MCVYKSTCVYVYVIWKKWRKIKQEREADREEASGVESFKKKIGDSLT